MLDIHKKAAVILLSLGFLSGFPACRKEDRISFRAIRLVDRLGKEDVRQSFLSGLSEVDRQRFVPVDSVPLSGLGIGENPYGIKKKIDLGVVEIDMLFAPPKSEYKFDLLVPEDGILEFGAGIIRDRNFEELKNPFPAEAERVDFLVRIEAGGYKKTLFQKFIPLPPLKEIRTLELSVHKVPLPDIEGDIRLTLTTEGEGKAFAFWQNPVVYTAGRKTRGVILVSVDTLRPDHLHAYGYGRTTSPNLDALAADGVVFERAYSSSPWTLPAHVSLLTSLFGLNHGVYSADDKMDPSLTTLAEMLRQSGFFTSAVTGGGFVSGLYGFSRGFDTYAEGDGAVNYVNSAELVSGAASQWLDNHKDKNFFLFLHTYQTHVPYDCPPPFNTMFLEPDAAWHKLDLTEYLGGKASVFRDLPDPERRNIIGLYDGEIRYTDEFLVKTLVEKLKALGLYDETMIILTSDHGEEFYEHGAWLHGAHLYDESIRVPLIIKFPGSRYKGTRVGNIVRMLDIMPTVLEEMRVAMEGLNLDGLSLLPVIKGREKGDRTFLADTCWLYVEGCGEKGTAGGEASLPSSVTRNDGRHKFILNRGLGRRELDYYKPPPAEPQAAELYDLDSDPFEKANLTPQKADVANRLARLMLDLYSGGPKKRPSKAVFSKDLEEQLRTLGYIK